VGAVTPYEVRFSPEAEAEFAQLDPAAGKRIYKRLEWLAANFEAIHEQPLTGKLAGLYKFRIGDYRALYAVDRDQRVIVIQAFGHRSDIYKRQ
jgi:mRNA interferase RelE/StbE